MTGISVRWQLQLFAEALTASSDLLLPVLTYSHYVLVRKYRPRKTDVLETKLSSQKLQKWCILKLLEFGVKSHLRCIKCSQAYYMQTHFDHFHFLCKVNPNAGLTLHLKYDKVIRLTQNTHFPFISLFIQISNMVVVFKHSTVKALLS